MQKKDKYWLHILLFVITFVTTTLAGSELVMNKRWYLWLFSDFPANQLPGWSDFVGGFTYSIAFITFLTFHEFGHYFTSVYHRVKCSLPFYIPIFLPFFPVNIGSMGAVIRIKQIPESTKQYFDIGIAGPLAGFVISIFLLTYGFLNLPPLESLYDIHPEYLDDFGYIPSEFETIQKYLVPNVPLLRVGNSLIFHFFETFIADQSLLPNHFEIIHYPFIYVGYLTLFFTALNLLPIGQLDGGHIIYGLFGSKKAGIISRLMVICLLVFGGLGIIDFNELDNTLSVLGMITYVGFLYYVSPYIVGKNNRIYIIILVLFILVFQQFIQNIYYQSNFDSNRLWLVFSFLTTRVLGVNHPIAKKEHKLDKGRTILGWIGIIIFILCFTPAPLEFLFYEHSSAPVYQTLR